MSFQLHLIRWQSESTFRISDNVGNSDLDFRFVVELAFYEREPVVPEVIVNGNRWFPHIKRIDLKHVVNVK